ncbi:MAG: fructose-bisphosphate aldolase [Thermoprotei archaeon]|nr:MAG: fructose-bisphosphate aldolase [Thermoprotei archaeon]RLE97684.1 MAG: fructose-bisphosphate aldolase [Thermoprotei archaeon]
MCAGKKLRLNRIFRRSTGRTVIIALDHGRRHGPLRGIEDLGQVVERVLRAEVDALMMTPAMIERVADCIAGRVSVIARIDGTGTVKGPDETDDRLIASVARAVKVGADAVSIMVYLGSPREAQNLEKLARVVEDADAYGMPVLAEVLPRPPHLPEVRDSRVVAYASRIAAELGADVIKTYYTGDGFEHVVRCTPAPIVVLGGPRREAHLAPLVDAYEAIKRGARGVAYGRNVFQFERPEVMARALLYVVHERIKPREAMERALSDLS